MSYMLRGMIVFWLFVLSMVLMGVIGLLCWNWYWRMRERKKEKAETKRES